MIEWLLLIVVLIASLLALLVSVLWSASIFLSGAPFVPVPQAAIKGIVHALELEKDSVVYDMGCGDARILSACLKERPGISAIGIEKALYPYLLAKYRCRDQGIQIIREDFFQVSLTEATHIVLYLFPELMNAVEEKIVREVRPGTKVLAIDFAFKNRQPDLIIEQDIPSIERGKYLSLYIF